MTKRKIKRSLVRSVLNLLPISFISFDFLFHLTSDEIIKIFVYKCLLHKIDHVNFSKKGKNTKEIRLSPIF